MSYKTTFAISQDPYMRNRLAAAVALDGIEMNDPEDWVNVNRWKLATQPGWADAWEEALDNNSGDFGYTPGNDETTITDAMILAAVRAVNAPAV